LGDTNSGTNTPTRRSTAKNLERTRAELRSTRATGAGSQKIQEENHESTTHNSRSGVGIRSDDRAQRG
jgi:hypothetical protein